ncbi:MAG TPA: LysR family transcriptional regulator [Burkholderiales bacterium]|nr:LysR family transcriptional regulator [Burkholderiales bacterium]
MNASSDPRITLEQWATLVSVVESGGYSKAGERLHKSQSTLTYAIKKLERLLGVRAFELRGRKAVLTATGELLYRRGKVLVEEAARLEHTARDLAKGWEAEIRLAAEILFPTWLLLRCMGEFGAERPETHVELYETVLGGTEEALAARQVDFAIASSVPPGFVGDVLMPVRAICVAAPSHPLHALGRQLTLEDLRRHRHIVIRDSGARRTRPAGWLNETRWTVTNKATSIHAVSRGFGYAWLAEDTIMGELQRGALKALPLREGAVKLATLYLVFADRDAAGPGALRLSGILREGVKRECDAARNAESKEAAP